MHSFFCAGTLYCAPKVAQYNIPAQKNSCIFHGTNPITYKYVVLQVLQPIILTLCDVMTLPLHGQLFHAGWNVLKYSFHIIIHYSIGNIFWLNKNEIIMCFLCFKMKLLNAKEYATEIQIFIPMLHKRLPWQHNTTCASITNAKWKQNDYANSKKSFS